MLNAYRFLCEYYRASIDWKGKLDSVHRVCLLRLSVEGNCP